MRHLILTFLLPAVVLAESQPMNDYALVGVWEIRIDEEETEDYPSMTFILRLELTDDLKVTWTDIVTVSDPAYPDGVTLRLQWEGIWSA